MGMFDFLKKRKKADTKEPETPEIGTDSELPVHEEFVDEKGLREMKKKKK